MEPLLKSPELSEFAERIERAKAEFADAMRRLFSPLGKVQAEFAESMQRATSPLGGIQAEFGESIQRAISPLRELAETVQQGFANMQADVDATVRELSAGWDPEWLATLHDLVVIVGGKSGKEARRKSVQALAQRRAMRFWPESAEGVSAAASAARNRARGSEVTIEDICREQMHMALHIAVAENRRRKVVPPLPGAATSKPRWNPPAKEWGSLPVGEFYLWLRGVAFREANRSLRPTGERKVSGEKRERALQADREDEEAGEIVAARELIELARRVIHERMSLPSKSRAKLAVRKNYRLLVDKVKEAQALAKEESLSKSAISEAFAAEEREMLLLLARELGEEGKKFLKSGTLKEND